jgi:hypothetical protein
VTGHVVSGSRTTTSPSRDPIECRRWRPKIRAWWQSPLAAPLIAVAAATAWLPNLPRPLSPDEGGFLLVASQWSPGTSLYGNYWVDRPPLLIGLFQLADLAGGKLAMRLLGLLAIVFSVLLAARIGRFGASRLPGAPSFASATAAVFVTTPLFGASEVDGEMLAVPLVLAGVVAVLRALEVVGLRSSRTWTWWWAAAGAAGTAAPLVKQSMVEAFVVAAVGIGWLLVRRRTAGALAATAALGFGAACLLGSVLTWAAARGTDPGGLWDAVVVFRADATSVISAHASSATPQRAAGLAVAFAASGAVLVIVGAFLPGARRDRPRRAGAASLPDPRILAGAVLAWEALAVALGGSYWLHYLLGTVPGLVLATSAVLVIHPARARLVAIVLIYGAVIGVATTMGVAVADRAEPSDVAVAHYLAQHKRSGDTAVVGFGNPAILEGAGMSSPYPQLWSLPVRVRDPKLAAFTRVLVGQDRPTWVVVSGSTLATWGVDASRAQAVFDRNYRLVEIEGDYRLYRVRRAVGGR